jgi:CRISPR system Cascade subunit CasE
MNNLWFSRIRLKRDAHIRAIADLLLPTDDKRKILAARHKLIWSLFSDDKERERDFLWREDRENVFFTLSARQPANDMFDIETKPYELALDKGDNLFFSLRANPIISRKEPGSRRGKRHDIVMDRLREIPSGERGQKRDHVIQQAGHDWLAAQGERYGFALQSVKSDSYHQHILPRKNGKTAGNISTLDLEGRLTVTDPDKFLAKLIKGFGSAKAFGCGLMMIKRG